MAPRSALWQIYLLTVCLLCLLTLGIAGTAALFGSLRLHYPKLLLDDEQYASLISITHFAASNPTLPTIKDDEPALRAAWHRHGKLLLRRQRHLGMQALVRWTIVALLAVVIFVPHLWAARRVARGQRPPPPSRD
jgi:hypothetical protein